MILSCLLINSETIEINFSKLYQLEAFYFKNHQEIYSAIIKIYVSKITNPH